MLQSGEECRNLRGKFRKVVSDSEPNALDVHAKVIVNQLVSHPSDVTPWDVRLQVFRLGGKTFGGFTHDFNLPDDCILDEFVLLEVGFIQTVYISANTLGCIADMLKIYSVVMRHR